MDTNKAISLLKEIMTEITVSGGYAATDSFSSLREVDTKVRETKMVLSGSNGLPPNFISEMDLKNGSENNY